MRKNSDVVSFPKDYTYALFIVHNKSFAKYVLACSKDHAREKAKIRRGRVYLVQSSDILKENGHKKTHAFYKYFGNEWVVKHNNIFFKQQETQGSYIRYVD